VSGKEAGMAIKKATKQYTVFSDNEKMDTSGMAGKPKEYKPIEWKTPVMTIDDIMEVQEYKNAKRPDTEEE
jgi:hypothetical protein